MMVHLAAQALASQPLMLTAAVENPLQIKDNFVYFIVCVWRVGDSGRARMPCVYNAFLFSSRLMPPGPRSTTMSRPPTTDMVWKKS